MADGSGVEVLRLALDTSGVEQGAARASEAFDSVAQGAERVARANERAGQSFSRVRPDTEGARRALDQLGQSAGAADRALQQLGTGVGRAASAVRRAESEVRASALESVRAQIDAMERQFADAALRLREAQLQGLLTPEEAAARGREIGEQYKAALQGALRQLEPGGVIAGAGPLDDIVSMRADLVGRLDQVNRTLGQTERTAQRSTVALGRLSGSFASLAAQAAGTHPIVGRVATVVGSFALGTAMTTGVLAGLAAIALAYNKLTEDARKAKERQEEVDRFFERLRERQRIEDLGPGGEVLDNAIQQAQKLNDLTQERIRLEERLQELRFRRPSVTEEELVEGEIRAGMRRLQQIEQQAAQLRSDLVAASRALGEIDSEQSERLAREANQQLQARVSLLTSAWDLELRRGDVVREITALEADLTRQIEAGNLSLEQAVFLSQRRAELRAITMPVRIDPREIAQEVERAAAEAERLIREFEVRRRSQRDPSEFRTEGGGLRLDYRDTYASVAEGIRRMGEELRASAFAGREMTEEAKENAEEIEAAYEQAAEGIQRTFARAFRDIFSGGIEEFDDLGDAIVDIFAGVAGQIAAAFAADRLGLDDLERFFRDHPTFGRLAGGAAIAGMGAVAGYRSGDPGGGALSGAFSGAALGSVVPGIGTAVGAVLGGVSGLVGGLFGQADRVREADRAMRRAMEEWADALVPRTLIEQAQARIEREFEALAEQIRARYGVRGGPDLSDPANIDREALEILAGSPIATGDMRAFAQELLALLDIYDQWLEKIREENELRRQQINEDLDVRALRAQGLDDEAEALQRQIQQEREIQRLKDDGYIAEAERLREIHRLENDRWEAEKARQREEEERRRQREELEKQRSIEQFDFEIAARRAALAGDDLTAAQIRGEAEIQRQIAAWEELVAQGKMTEEQLLELSEIMREELARSIEAAAAAAERAKMAFEQSVEYDWLSLFGAPGEADRFRITTEAERRREEARRLLEDDPERLAAVLQKIDEIEARMLAQLEGGGVGAAARAGRAGRDRVREEVIRSVTGITELQANRLIDVQMSALMSLREIAFNTSVLRAGDGASLPIIGASQTGGRVNVHIEVNVGGAGGLNVGNARFIGQEIGRGIAEDPAFVQALNRTFGPEIGREIRISGDARVS